MMFGYATNENGKTICRCHWTWHINLLMVLAENPS